MACEVSVIGTLDCHGQSMLRELGVHGESYSEDLLLPLHTDEEKQGWEKIVTRVKLIV